MNIVHAPSAGLVWRAAARVVLQKGEAVEDDGQMLREALDVVLVVDDPEATDPVVDRLGDPEMLAWMRANFLDPTPIEGWGYSYGSRIQNLGGVPQLERIIAKLRRAPDSKSATLALQWPAEDGHHVPCVTAIDFKRRSGSLQARVFMRSQDVAKKLYADILSLGALMRTVADALEVPVGTLRIYIASLHSYPQDEQRLHDVADLAGETS